MHFHVPFPTLVGNATYVALLAGMVLAVWLSARRAPTAVLLISAAALAILPTASALARHVAALALIWAGGSSADAVALWPFPYARHVTVAFVAIWFIRFWRTNRPAGRRVALGIIALVAGTVVATVPWALDSLERRIEVYDTRFRNAEWRMSKRARPRWLRGSSALIPSQFSMGFATDGPIDRAWACGLSSRSLVVCWHPEREHIDLDVLSETPISSQVSVGWGRACAVDMSERSHCWDSLGHELPMPDLPNASSVEVAGAGYACIRAMDGGVTCWDGPPWVSPIQGPWPLGISNVRLLAAGYQYGVCVVSQTGAALCWDRNHLGVGGGAYASTTIGTVVSAPALSDAVGLSACSLRVCGILRDGAVRCMDWLRNVETPRLPIAHLMQVAVSEDHACARNESGRVACWGDDEWGQSDEDDVNDAAWVATSHAVTCVARAGGIECRGRGIRR
jgi:hypothetical protein